jgi:hypothetical protein
MSRWLAEGRALGQSLRRFHAIVVAGGAADAVADVALGIAESQAAVRHVVLGDLLGDSPRYAEFRTDEDPHGLVDAFDFGISLGRVARPIPANPQLQFASTGSTTPDYVELLTHPRWKTLVASFAQTDHLLIVAAPLEAPKLAELVRDFDGLILVDGLAPAEIDESRIIATVVTKRASVTVPAVAAPVPVPVSVAAPAPASIPTAPPAATAAARRPVRQTTVLQALAKPVGVGAGLSVLAALFVFWLLGRPYVDKPPIARSSDTAVPKSPAVAASSPAATPEPTDSGTAPFAVQIMSANTQAGANLKLQENGDSLPAATYSPVEISGRIWYKVLAGAYTTRAGADSLLGSLRSSGRLDSLAGIVVRAPFAVLIDSIPQSSTISDVLANFRDGRQQPVYALKQRNGWVWILTGAFETRSQAEWYAEKVRASVQGAIADVVIRQGRMF